MIAAWGEPRPPRVTPVARGTSVEAEAVVRRTRVWEDRPVNRVSSMAATGCRLVDRVRRRAEIPIVLCVDVEPDLRTFGRGDARPWSGFEHFLERLPSLRRRLSGASGETASLTWFLRMDPQVAETWGTSAWVAEAHAEGLAALTGCGDELGLHTHTWRWDGAAATWIADYRDEAWAEHCLVMGLEAFESSFGRPCLSHRGGDHFLCSSMLARLTAAGAKIDLTIEPGWPPAGPPGGERAAGVLPDYRSVPRRPYRSSPTRFPAPDPAGGGPLMVPLFSPPALRRSHRLPLPPDSRHFTSRLAFELLRETPPALALVLRSDAALDSWDLVAANLEHLSRHHRVRFVTASAAADLLAAG